MRILIADDEILVRIGLKTVIEGFGEEHEVVEACDGVDALEKYLKFKPSLVFVDINMPRLDGFGFIEAAKREKGDSRFIILSCYSDFPHLRNAIKAGISDYIIKTALNNEELHGIIRETDLMGKRVVSNEDKDISCSNSGLIGEEEFIKAITCMEYDVSTVESFIAQKGIEKTFDLLVTEEKGIVDAEETNRGLETGVSNTLIDMVNEYGSGYVINSGRQRKLILLSLSNNMGGKSHEENLDEFCTRLLICLKNYFNKDFSISIFRESTVPTLAETVRMAEDALKYGFYDNDAGYYYYCCEDQELTIEAESKTLKQGVDDALAIYEFHKISGLLDTYVEAVRQKRTIKIEKVIDTFFRVFYSISRYTELNLKREKDEIIDSKIDYSYFLGLGNIYRIAGVIKSVVFRLIEVTTENDGNYYNSIIKKAKDYIDKNFEEEIRLGTVAQYVNLSPSHFSKIFKDTYGINFIDYCISVRIEKAKAYINEGMKVFVAAEKVGYGSYSYFSRLFKKVTGITPEEYKGLKDKHSSE